MRNKAMKFILIMMITLLVLGLGIAGNGTTVQAVDFNIDNIKIDSHFPTDLAGEPETKVSWWDKAGDWVSDKWNGFTDWCGELWDDVNNILDDLGAKIKSIKDTLWEWGLTIGAGVTLAWAILKKQFPMLKVLEWAAYFLKGVLRGLADMLIGVFDLALGAVGLLGYVILNPRESWDKLKHWATHPGEVWDNISNAARGIWKEITESWDRMVINGDGKSRSEWFGYAFSQLLGLKGVDKAGKAGNVVSKSGGLSSKFPLTSKAFDAISDSLTGLGDKVKSFGDNLFGSGKRILATTTAGAVAVTGLTFAWPKIEPLLMKFKDCVAIQQQDTGHYVASIQLPLAKLFDCHVGKDSDIKLPDGSGKTNKIAEVDPYIRERIKEQNVEKYGNEPSSNKTWSPDPNMGKIVEKNGGKKYITYYDGKTERAILKSEFAGSKAPITVNGKNYEVPFDESGFPDFAEWTGYESQLSVDQYLLSDPQQFKLLSKRVSKDIERDENIKKEIDDTLFDVLNNGVGDRNTNGGKKLNTFLTNNPTLKQKMSDSEFNDIISGKGSKSFQERLATDRDMKEEFSRANREWIKRGEDPVGYTWHHNQSEGRMQLVESKVHGAVRHTGGRPTWGGHNR
ncbi:DNase/tRNase domain of colicin-like bacteriocin [Thermoactinomyces sp. DSM 45891]|uniref:HNH endonuclease n=1 Tax=Thermoactinomyces sp. DSM 45891 TaxID=1761907 RepID=UPI000915C075|nr:HNH endonuclease [Thermoactinomyces sp. DSM 45891]SFX82559.1 DNase/tRNase domain of colicin-like bacteriocin [Thermoactinomyces sp. DSM 45891]